MNVFEFIKSKLSTSSEPQAAPDGYCPNCWGRQEYSGKFYDSVKVEGINTNNLDDKKGWVQGYAEKYLTGIQLTENDAQLVCNNCQMRYELNH